MTNEIIDLIKHWHKNPVDFVRTVLGAEPQEWQASALMAIANNDRVAIKSGKGVGKSSLLAWIILWFLATRPGAKVACTANSANQLEDVLWSEVRKWIRQMEFRQYLPFEVSADKVTLFDGFARARTARKDNPEALQGLHCFSEGCVDVLTETGWLPLEDIAVGDRVMSMDVSGRAVYAPVSKVWSHFYEGDMAKVSTRFIDFMVTPNHKFMYEHRQCNKYADGGREVWKPFVREIRNMHGGTNRIPKTIRFTGQSPEFMKWEGARYGKESGGVIAARDFAAFLGWYLSEGYITKTGIGIAQSAEKNPKNYSEIAALIERMGLRASRGKSAIMVGNGAFAEWFRTKVVSAKSYAKRVPEYFFHWGHEEISALLDAYCKGDGYGERFYVTSSKGMADDLQRLILLRGGYATITNGNRKGSVCFGEHTRNHDVYRVREFTDRAVDYSYVRSNTIEYVPYSGKVGCLEVEGTHMFYVRSRVKKTCFWTHNSDNMLFLADEASGIDEIIFQAAEGAMSTKGAKTVLTGNPTRTKGYFFDAFGKDASRWVGITVDCNNSPMVTKEYIRYMAEKWGEDSNEYRVGVMGEFPLGDVNGVIPLYLIERAVGRNDVVPYGEEVWGVDVARMGDDRCALVKRRGNVVMEKPQTWGQVTLDVTADRVFDEYMEARIKPVRIVVDAIGVGAGVADMLRKRGLPVDALNVAEVASSKKAYHRKRDELWFRAREWFETGNVSVPKGCDGLVEELAAVEYEIAPGGQRRILNKKALGFSPDEADALILTFNYRAVDRDKQYHASRMQTEVVCDASYMEYYN